MFQAVQFSRRCQISFLHVLWRSLCPALISLCVALQVNAETAPVAPAFSLTTLDESDTLSLSDYQGKVIYLDFWASWCAPCRKSLPLLNELRNELKSEGFEVLAINVDELREDGIRFLEEYPVDYPTLFDNQGVAATYQLRGMPTAYLIDRDGLLHSQHVGFNPKDMSDIRAEVTQLLKQ